MIDGCCAMSCVLAWREVLMALGVTCIGACEENGWGSRRGGTRISTNNPEDIGGALLRTLQRPTLAPVGVREVWTS